MAMPVKTSLLDRSEGQQALADPFMGANRHPNTSREGEMHDVMLSRGDTSQFCLTRLCIEMPYKCYSIHSNEVLDRYFYYSPKDFIWMCRLTDTPACENAVREIEQQLETERDLDFRGLLSDKVIYIQGHWVPLVHANGVSEEERALVELAGDTMQLHSRLENEWLPSTTAIKLGAIGCRDGHIMERCSPMLKPLILSSPRPVEKQGEHMFVPPISALTTTRDSAVEYDRIYTNAMDTNENMFVSLAHRDEKSD